MNQYVIGTLTQLQGVFVDQDGNLVDPADVTATLIEPDGTVVDLTDDIVHAGSGTYVVDYAPTKIGLHEYRFAGTTGGIPLSAGEKNFNATTDFPTSEGA